MKKEFNLVLNTPHAVEQSKRKIDQWFKEITSQGGQVFHLFLKPFKPPKTNKQLGAIRVLCDQMSKTDVNEHAGHSSNYWYRHYKARAYIPLLEKDALEFNDDELVQLIGSARQLIKAMRGASLFNFDLRKVVIAYNVYLKAALANQRKKPEAERLSLDAAFDAAAEKFIKFYDRASLGKHDDGYTAIDFIADNPAFSFAHASKEHLIEVINYILDDAAKRGVFVELKKDDE